MTAAAHIPRTVASPRAAGAVGGDWIAFTIAVGFLLIAYLLLQNPYWVPGGDSEVYVAIARNLLVGEGYRFNGWPVSMVPPGWVWFLAAAMKIWPSFALLKMLNMLCMLGSLAVSYWICRRFASPRLSAMVIVLTGMLCYVYSLTFWLHSDALFCLTSSISLLLAMQISEERTWRWRIVVLILLCIANVLVRWAGLFSWLMVAAVLLHGRLGWPWRFDWVRRVHTQAFWRMLDRRWIAVLVTGAVTLGTFQVLRAALTVTKEEARQARLSGGDVGGSDEAAQAFTPKSDATVATGYTIFNPAGDGIGGMIGRAGTWGNWFSYLLWQPFRLAQANALLAVGSVLIGWTVLLPLLIQAWRGIISREWFWPAMMLYSLALAMNWPNANARYLVPIAPFIILGFFKAFEFARLRFPSRAIATGTAVAGGYFVVSIILCNGALYVCDAWVARSSEFYRDYEAGLNQDLIAIAHWLNEHPDISGEIAVCERYVNLGRIRTSKLGLRATTMLTGKPILAVPKRYLASGDPRGNRHFLAWARSPEIGVKYVLYQPEVSPWRVFHFRLGWLQEVMTDEAAVDTGAGWRLYMILPEGDEAIRISVDRVPNWPTRVPGL